ncbi:MAG: preprotein translocase subunit SecE [Chloroflexi bacterium CG_4_10_14_0_8_um_filter_46_9]|nr:MAG: preprotein translocase subunit SecE [Dehalococcoidia bacterium CG2_30_46_19]PIW40280.1 MAG: preprotein translocase subunit SecE [Chloroflexi bacterium CG15_BIG_FIL_POST_REV_8_21_14_020_46_15]PIZ27294.1 MAG: preprotein translocase subunit SecE [Chloroflexi bacterium CG_4_10_14_0_8_um_filter_46_9]
MPKKKSRLSFLTEAIAELRKAHWPTRQELLRLSAMVLVLCILIGAILGILDYGFTKLFTALVIGS